MPILGCLNKSADEMTRIIRPFVLLAGTVIALLIFIGGSVSLLYTIGNQELPNVLTGGVAGSKRD
jgi:hypothetical protein